MRSYWEKLQSRKFQSVIVYAFVVFLAEVMGWEIAYQVYYAVAGLIGLYIYVEGKVDAANKG